MFKQLIIATAVSTALATNMAVAQQDSRSDIYGYDNNQRNQQSYQSRDNQGRQQYRDDRYGGGYDQDRQHNQGWEEQRRQYRSNDYGDYGRRDQQRSQPWDERDRQQYGRASDRYDNEQRDQQSRRYDQSQGRNQEDAHIFLQGYIEGKEEGLEQGLMRGYRQGYVQGVQDAASSRSASGHQQGATNQRNMRDPENQTPPSPVGTEDTEGPADMLNSGSEDPNGTEMEDTDTEED